VVAHRLAAQAKLGGHALARHRAAEHMADKHRLDMPAVGAGIAQGVLRRLHGKALEGHVGGVFAEADHADTGDVTAAHRALSGSTVGTKT